MPVIIINGVAFEQEKKLSLYDIRDIPESCYPMPVVCYNVKAFFTFAVAARTDGDYSHFMWLIGPNEFATQGWWFRSVPVVPRDGKPKYGKYIIKFWYNPYWTPDQRQRVIRSLRADLAKSHWETRYDVLALVGHLFGLKWIQAGGLEICSDSADHLVQAGEPWTKKDQNPSQINAWFKQFPARWYVYGRYQAGD